MFEFEVNVKNLAKKLIILSVVFVLSFSACVKNRQSDDENPLLEEIPYSQSNSRYDRAPDSERSKEDQIVNKSDNDGDITANDNIKNTAGTEAAANSSRAERPYYFPPQETQEYYPYRIIEKPFTWLGMTPEELEISAGKYSKSIWDDGPMHIFGGYSFRFTEGTEAHGPDGVVQQVFCELRDIVEYDSHEILSFELNELFGWGNIFFDESADSFAVTHDFYGFCIDFLIENIPYVPDNTIISIREFTERYPSSVYQARQRANAINEKPFTWLGMTPEELTLSAGEFIGSSWNGGKNHQFGNYFFVFSDGGEYDFDTDSFSEPKGNVTGILCHLSDVINDIPDHIDIYDLSALFGEGSIYYDAHDGLIIVYNYGNTIIKISLEKKTIISKNAFVDIDVNDFITVSGKLSVAEQALLIRGERFLRESILSYNGLYEPISIVADNWDGRNKHAVTIEGYYYTPVDTRFGFNSTKELRSALQEYFTDNYITKAGIFTPHSNGYTPAFYIDYDNRLYQWDEGDYWGENARYLFEDDLSYTLVARDTNKLIIDRGIYVLPLYGGLLWCTERFSVIDNKIDSSEHIKDIGLSTDAFIGYWKGYTETGRFAKGYYFAPDGTATVFFKEGYQQQFSEYAYNTNMYFGVGASEGLYYQGDESKRDSIHIISYSKTRERFVEGSEIPGISRLIKTYYYKTDIISLKDGAVVFD